MILAAYVTCAFCGTEYLGSWPVEAESPEEVDEPPRAVQRCPECEHGQEEEYPGWVFRTEPG